MIIKGIVEDIEKFMEIYEKARKFMIKSGNKNQLINGYPSKEIILEDIKNGNFYVLKDDKNILAIFTFIGGIDNTYLKIYDGSWRNDSPYFTIHRIASSFIKYNVFHEVIEFCKTKTNHIRIDTHKDNIVMQKAILKEGFTFQGIIYLENGDPRLAYEFIDKNINL